MKNRKQITGTKRILIIAILLLVSTSAVSFAEGWSGLVTVTDVHANRWGDVFFTFDDGTNFFGSPDEFWDNVEGLKSCLSIALTAMMSGKKVRLFLGDLTELGGYAPSWEAIEIAE